MKYTPKPKQPKAVWTRAFPKQMRGEKKKPLVFKPRKPIRRVSKMKAKSDRVYNAAAREFVSGRRCCVYASQQATQVHHQRGRCSTLKMDKRFWLPVSAEGHRMIHDHPENARKMDAFLESWDKRKLKLLCAPGEWNTPVPEFNAAQFDADLAESDC